MTADTLHTKYRPTKFSEVLGQDHFLKQLAGIVADRTARSYLFHGPAGCGKTTLARICSKQLGCRDADIIEHDGATKNGVEDLRELQNSIRYKPIGGGTYRAVILDEVHRITGNAFDSILKIVEEPPSHLFWLFCTTNPAKVPQTIRSRCQIFAVREVDPLALTTLLKDVAKREGLKIPEDVISYIAGKSLGSPRVALVNLERCATCKTKREAAASLEQVVNEETVIELARYICKVDQKRAWPKVMELIEKCGEANLEAVRIQVANYVGVVLQKCGSDADAVKYLPILEAFSVPFPTGEGRPALMLAVGRALYAE